MKMNEYTFSIGTGRSHITDHVHGWTDGTVYTVHGIVEVYAQGRDGKAEHTTLRFVHNGRCHVRNFHEKRYTARGMSRKAKQFAREVVTCKEDKP